MNFPFAVVPATFLERPNRFRIEARLEDGSVVSAHCPDPGRLRELLIPDRGIVVHLSQSAGANRKTAYDLRFVEQPETGILISLDTRLPNQIVGAALRDRLLAPFADLVDIRAEVTTPLASNQKIRSRFDFHGVDSVGRPCWIEVKSVTLVEGDVALFPDAVTARGRRHLLELMELIQVGQRAAVVFVVQRPDAHRVEANRNTDPAFADALAAAGAHGVELYAWTVDLNLERARIARPIPVVTRLPLGKAIRDA